MAIKYTPPPFIEVRDNDVIISSDVDVINFQTGLTVTDNGDGYSVTVDASGGVASDGYITIKDDGYVVRQQTSKINFRTNLAAYDDGDFEVSVDSSLGIFTDGYFIDGYFVDDAYNVSFTDFFSATTDGYGNVIVDAGAGADVLSPGFTWGRSGQVGNGAYLLNDTVPSNLTGRVVPIESGIISKILVANQQNNTFNVVVQKHLGGGLFQDLATVSLINERTKVAEPIGGIAVTFGDELAVKIDGSSKQPVVGLIIKGGN